MFERERCERALRSFERRRRGGEGGKERWRGRKGEVGRGRDKGMCGERLFLAFSGTFPCSSTCGFKVCVSEALKSLASEVQSVHTYCRLYYIRERERERERYRQREKRY